MVFMYNAVCYLVCLAWLCCTVSAFGRHAAQYGLFQLPPSFARDGVHMYPSLHPAHNSSDLKHLEPHRTKQLYYSQEGHRPALHGAKHADLMANFSNPAVVLEHSNHISGVICRNNDHIEVCFKTHQAMTTVERAWNKYIGSEHFFLLTYHNGCGHLNGEQRSIFRSSNAVFHNQCVTVEAELIDEKEALHGGELTWGTYKTPHLAKRAPVMGNVQVVKPTPQAPEGFDLDQNGTEIWRNGTRLWNSTMGGTVDLTKNGTAARNFFGTNSINIDIADQYEMGLDFLSDEEYESLVKRGLFSWIIQGINAILNAVISLIEQTRQLIETAAKIIIAIAVTAVKLLMVPFGVPFKQSYEADIRFDNRLGGAKNQKIATDLGSALGGTSNNFVLSKQGAAVAIECVSCGARADFSFEGALAFSISKGITEAKVSFINHKSFIFDAIYGVTVDARALKDKAPKGGFKTSIEKQLLTLPFFAIQIPKIIKIGPQVSINAAVSAYVDAHIEFTAGARFTIDAGLLVLNAVDSSKNKFSGFTPHLDPVFKIKDGNAVATLDVALPVGVEVALDVLSGTWEKSIGVYTAPSIYFTAGLSTGEGKKCTNGVELRAGAKNRIYSSALGIWEYEFLSTTFYETGLGCISTADGWSPKQVEPTDGLFKDVAKSFGGEGNLATNKTLQLTRPEPVIYSDDHFTKENAEKTKNKLRRLPNTSGFRLIQIASQSATLVSGIDGYIYLVDNKAGYDISAPWGGLEVDKNIFSYDVFGRLIHYYGVDAAFLSTASVRVSDAQSMPQGAKAATFSVMKDGSNKETYGISFKHPNNHHLDELWFPTVCKIPEKGLRLFATKFIVDENGVAHSRSGDENLTKFYKYVYKIFRKAKKLGDDPKVCATVWLTSDPKSMTT